MKEVRALNEEQVGRQFISSILLFVNEVELSIYRFLTLKAKTIKK